MTHQVKLGTKPVNGSRGYFLCKCDECGWLGSSEEATGGGELYYCPICSAQEPDEQVGAAQVFNTMLAHIDAQAARIAELELALFAENQKRLDVERQRDQLLAALEKAVVRQAYKPGSGPDWWEQGRAAIAEAKGGAS